MRMKMVLEEQEITQLWDYRTIGEDDIRGLGLLMLESYVGAIDYEGETLEDAISEVEGTLHGKYGPFVRTGSLLIEEGRAVSACIVVWSEEMNGLLLAYVMTHPDFRGEGMATFLLKESMNRLQAEGYKEMYLVVTEGNPAQHLYEKIGFCRIES